MDLFLTYLIKVSLIYLLFFAVYWALFRRETFFRRNRVFLLFSLVLPALIPLIKFPVKSSLGGLVPEQGGSWIIMGGKTMSEPAATNLPSVPVESVSSTWIPETGSLILMVYLAGVLFFLMRMIISYSKVIRLIASSKHEPLYKMILVITRKMVSPFSIFKWLVIPDIKTNHPDLDKIVGHEMVHYKQKHSYDLILSELMIAFQWFNPFAWMLKSSVVRNNEFLVDQTLISGVVDQREYQYALLNNSIGQQKLAMVNGFSKGLIKKRIKMMNKRKTRLVNRIKEVLLLPFALIIILAFSAYTNKASDNLQDPDRKIVKKEQKAEVNSHETKAVSQASWTVAKNEGRTIVDGDTWTITEEQDQDKKKKKKEGDKEEISIYINGKMLKLRSASGDGEDSHIKIIKLSDLDNLEGLKGDFSKEKIAKLIENIDTDGENTILMVRESKKEGKEVDIYAGTVVVKEGAEGEEGAIFIETLDDKIKVYAGEDKGNILYVSDKEGGIKIHFADDDKGKNMLFLLDGKEISSEEMENLDSDNIYSISILDSKDELKEYGEKGKNGVIKITTKK